EVPPKLQGKVKVDTYPKLQVLAGTTFASDEGHKQINFFEPHHLAFLNLDEIYVELQAYKTERGWINFSLSKNQIVELLSRRDWYQLMIPSPELSMPASFHNSRQWQATIVSLLK